MNEYLYRVPYGVGFAESGRNRWVYARSAEDARERACETWGTYPTDVFRPHEDRPIIWERRPTPDMGRKLIKVAPNRGLWGRFLGWVTRRRAGL